ncbi:MAG: ribonuclease R [Chitinophagaceae bacterium]|nr:ribonuclease R [Chitinophagaceae bacterium]
MGKKKGKKKEVRRVQGVLEITRSGMGFVTVKGKSIDVLIRPNDINEALDGDTVVADIKNTRGQRPEGKITGVVERKQTEFVGTVQLNTHFGFLVVSTDKAVPDFFIRAENLNGAKNGDKVVAELLGWRKGDRKPEAKVLYRLDAKNEVDMAMKEIIIQNGFSINFPKEVLDESLHLKAEVTEQELKQRRDFRDVLTVTIDPADAKDFDDAISFRKLETGNFEIGVHIADVSHFVRPGSALDDEAYKRACSVYLPDRVVPMLPEKISNELCSLRPDEEKFTFSAVFTITPKGKVTDSWLGPTIIRSNRRFAYEEVQAIIESGKGELSEELVQLNKIARILREQRFAKGAINFTSIEVRFLLDAEGRPRGVILKESKESHQLIEEFMLLANRTVANYVHKIKKHNETIPFPYRIHDVPDQDKLKPFAVFAGKFGYKFDITTPKAVASSFNAMIQNVDGKPEQQILEQLGIRTMAKAEYSTDNIGHYGLGFDNYCHFTSPIRRYPDVMVHRILRKVLTGEFPVDKSMEKKCDHSSERERAAMEAERAANKFEQVLYMQDKVGEEMDGIVSGVSSFGFWVETIEGKCEGMVNVRDLSDYDDFRHDEAEYSLVGLRTGKRFRMGDPVRVKLVAANIEKRQLDFEWIPHRKKNQDTTKGKNKKRKS